MNGPATVAPFEFWLSRYQYKAFRSGSCSVQNLFYIFLAYQTFTSLKMIEMGPSIF